MEKLKIGARRWVVALCLVACAPVFAQHHLDPISDSSKTRVKSVAWANFQDTRLNFILESKKLAVIGREVDDLQLSQMTEQATSELRGEGFLVGQVVLSGKNKQLFLNTGDLYLTVFLGAVGKISVINSSAVDASWIESVANNSLCPDGLGDACILTKAKFERMTQLLQDIAGVQLEGLNFSPDGMLVGQTQLVIVVRSKDSRVKGSVGVDNQGFTSTGVYRMGATASVSNLFSVGDIFSFNGFVSNGGSVSGSLDLSGPFNADGFRWQASLARSQFFVPNVSSSGFGNSLSVGASYPLVRGLDSNVTIGLNVVDVMTYSEVAQVATSNKTLQAGQLYLDANSGDRSIYLGQNSWAFRPGLVVGQVADVAAVQGSSQPLGSYTKLSFQGFGKYILSGGGNLYTSLNLRGQAANTNIDPYEKMAIGGFSGMRAYSLNEGSFNQGSITSVGLHNIIHTPWGRFTPHVFIDYANGWINHSTYSDWQVNSGYSNSQLSNHMVLSDAGLGVDWSVYKDLSLSALWARRLPLSPSGLSSTGNTNSQFWFLLQAFFN